MSGLDSFIGTVDFNGIIRRASRILGLNPRLDGILYYVLKNGDTFTSCKHQIDERQQIEDVERFIMWIGTWRMGGVLASCLFLVRLVT